MRPRINPVNEIKFAARHGFLTKPLWCEFFFKGSVSWQNKRWNYFRSSGIFRGTSEHSELLLLSPTHPLVKELAPTVSRPPNLNQLEHDKTIARTDLLLRQHLTNAQTVVEAEAKRRDHGFGTANPLGETDKYPDLTLRWKHKYLAIEVETSTKSLTRYRHVFERYLGSEFDHIVYVVNSAEIQETIESAAKEVGLKEELLRFASLKDWITNPLRAETVSETSRIKFESLLNVKLD